MMLCRRPFGCIERPAAQQISPVCLVRASGGVCPVILAAAAGKTAAPEINCGPMRAADPNLKMQAASVEGLDVNRYRAVGTVFEIIAALDPFHAREV